MFRGGAGSKVTVTFGADGSLELFRYDWPRYDRTDRAQTAMAPREILQRVRRVNFTRVGVAQDQKVEPVPPDAKAPVELGSRMTLQRLACGYYDPGVSVGDARASYPAWLLLSCCS